MNIDAIKNGIVIDHIEAGLGMEVYNFLKLEGLDCSVAFIKNVFSKKTETGRKDIIKIDQAIDLDLDVLGYLVPNATVSIIKDGKTIDKFKVALPKTLKNVIKCKNPRCITSVEQGIDHVFELVDEGKQVYRCIYCETKAKED